jgi:hypothetical protein
MVTMHARTLIEEEPPYERGALNDDEREKEGSQSSRVDDQSSYPTIQTPYQEFECANLGSEEVDGQAREDSK